MMRYLRDVQRVRRTIRQGRMQVMCVNARYYMTYENARMLGWWSNQQPCEPVFEQATPFVDVNRYVVGASVSVPLILSDARAGATIMATKSSGAVSTYITVEHCERAGQLRAKRFNKPFVPPWSICPA
ncbi:hypothetical protein K437DRAFT_253725 [Tilletiaria anomala UBC 951]|uniref:Oxidoreductase putative C-terminal domain-containing protein n=1 Tax=Tilletiaria anomala (strain ATCC 24038 / CBS 436.72 / UBC 951) TaxID=1037660 RepID=A0A066WJR6_TILAU|nr:uncharacterized protein K437DRAFT_253725 [Tilletiaria anomala UBC 951]KDN52798.1 hypothetical protein K437DRAFT_253725 [Tilletiaria anomala UBC 951]